MPSVFERHPKATLSLFLIFLAVIFLVFAEIALRFILPYDIGYYSATREQGVYRYPYGDITINLNGFPDQEFDLSGTKKRIGYFGDSVIYGVGVGEKHRFSTLLKEQFPKYDHWTFSMLGNGIQDLSMVKTAEDYGLDGVVYGFNLNDIVPVIATGKTTKNKTGKDVQVKAEKPPLLYRIQVWIYTNPDRILRGRSYLYTYVRTLAKNLLNRFGIGHTGFAAAELFPEENKELIGDVARRINEVAAVFKQRGIPFCVIIIPYEMQISKEAQEVYADLGIRWEEGFEKGRTQEILKEALDLRYVYDGMKAFESLPDDPKTGDYFVYNKGDKIDFNHPNRAGHALLATDFVKSRTCPLFR